MGQLTAAVASRAREHSEQFTLMPFDGAFPSSPAASPEGV